MKIPSISMPTIWLWIVNLANKLAQAAEYVRESFKNYTIVESKYNPTRNERLYNQTAKKQSPDVFLMFFVRKGDTEAERLRVKILSEYCIPDIPYYLEARNYNELKFRLRSSELCMEFYMDFLYDLCRPGDFLAYTLDQSVCGCKGKQCLCSF
jgi:hypothetical protein